MTRNVHVVAISGSLADDSGTRAALGEALSAAERAGARTTLVDLREYDLPTFDADDPDAGDAPELRRRFREADAILLGTPMYHGSFSSPLKTALDYAGFDEFEGTTVGLLAVSGGGFPTPALSGLRTVVRALDAWTLPLQVGIPDSAERFDDGELVDDPLEERVRRLGTELVRYAGVERYPELNDRTAEPISAD
jgi:NAD(P)H-dependent FMN reductase